MTFLLGKVDQLVELIDSINGNNFEQPKDDKLLFYKIMIAEIEGLFEDQRDFLANTANVSSLIYNKYHTKYGKKSTNWVGFYLIRSVKAEAKADVKRKQLRLGPFQGGLGCVNIEIGKGVCGTSAQTMKTVLVPDVHKFPGHIACDEASNAEIVVPLINDKGTLLGVLDIDSPTLNWFDQTDQLYLEKIAKLIAQGCDWPQYPDW